MSLTSEQINRVVRLTFDKKLVPAKPVSLKPLLPAPKGKPQPTPSAKPASLPGAQLGVPKQK